MKKIVMFASLLVLTLLLTFIPSLSTYANTSTDVLYNVYSPDYVKITDYWNGQEDYFIEANFDFPYTVSGPDILESSTSSFVGYDADLADYGFTSLTYVIDNYENDILTYYFDIEDFSSLILHWARLDRIGWALNDYHLNITLDYLNSSGLEEFEVSLSYKYISLNDGLPYSEQTLISFDNLDGFDLGSYFSTFYAPGISDIDFYFNNLRSGSPLRVTIEATLTDNDSFSFSSDGDVNGPGINTENLGAWLLDNINSFLSFELVPGFSLASLLGLMVCIPLLIFLFRMTLGG